MKCDKYIEVGFFAFKVILMMKLFHVKGSVVTNEITEDQLCTMQAQF